jgi:hypothetical protein
MKIISADKMNPAKEILIIEPTVGYMLKVLKSGMTITHFKNEFGHIRHGNYLDFLNLVQGPIPEMVTYNAGHVTNENTPRKTDCDFGLLLKAGPSLRIFYNNCIKVYGQIVDNDIPDEIYFKVVLFEIGLRMHANNDGLLSERENLIDVINKLCSNRNISQTDIDDLQDGRVFINMIKHFKNQFPSWLDGISAFKKAYEIIEKHEFTII